MKTTTIPLLASLLLLLPHPTLSSANPNPTAIYKWNNPFSPGLTRRQSGYHPEFGGCDDTGTTCAEACGSGYEECPAGTDMALFCYDVKAGQTCCRDEHGRACDKGFYCATDSKRTWCCPEGLSLSECEALFQTSLSTLNPSPTDSSPSSPTGGPNPTGPNPTDTTQTSSTTNPPAPKTTTVLVPTTILRPTTILAPFTKTLTETLTLAITDATGGEQTVTVTSEITVVQTETVVVGGGCTGVCETTGGPETITSVTSGPGANATGPPVVVTGDAGPERGPDGAVLARMGMLVVGGWFVFW